MKSLYENLPVDFLARFYYEIRKNIKKRVLSEAMYFELDLIEKAAKNKGITIEELHKYLFVH
ncbi:hypothetical protein [Neobacillus bataviensis]|uniref:hypothetical protein n=1 Tax=Neobacillus bataviensis TaxID=220685 RepID=UPI001CBDE088|nr:hypothetical protein [Neobacillus bataviensis]